MLKHFFLAVFLGFAILIGYTVYYTGFLKPVKVELVEQTSFLLVGLFHRGPYHEMVKKITQVETFFEEQQLSCRDSFGLYLDDPQTVEPERLRSFGGCVVQEPINWDELRHRFVAKTGNERTAQDFHIWQWTSSPTLTAYFEGAPGIAPIKVYPAMLAFAQNRQLPMTSVSGILERYVRKNEKELVTYYHYPLHTFNEPEWLKNK